MDRFLVMNIISYLIASFGFFLNVFRIDIIYLYKPFHKQMTIAFIVNQSIIDALAAVFLLLSTIFLTDLVVQTPGDL